ncbi:MAG: Fe-S-containing hydro-lyase [Chloroflexi bacterium]|nr:Fe-S-containing hydro-lyase [Chloroflexota bacterium]
MASPKRVRIESPIRPEVVAKLRTGDRVLITGTIYTARDAAHQRMVESLEKGEKLPFDIAGQTIYYMGPSPSPPGRVIGAAGPTTSSRMDSFTPRLLGEGLRAMIGKGSRSKEVKEAMKQHGAIYLAATGGAGALLSRAIRKAEVIAYPDLGPEAVRRLEVEDFPAIVVNDIYGGDLYEEGKARYAAAKADLNDVADADQLR